MCPFVVKPCVPSAAASVSFSTGASKCKLPQLYRKPDQHSSEACAFPCTFFMKVEKFRLHLPPTHQIEPRAPKPQAPNPTTANREPYLKTATPISRYIPKISRATLPRAPQHVLLGNGPSQYITPISGVASLRGPLWASYCR